MPTNRTPLRRDVKIKFTPEIIALYRRAVKLQDGCDAWEEEGGTRRACLDAELALHVALGRKPWQYDVTRSTHPDPPPTITNEWHLNMWREAYALYTQLEAAAEAEDQH